MNAINEQPNHSEWKRLGESVPMVCLVDKYLRTYFNENRSDLWTLQSLSSPGCLEIKTSDDHQGYVFFTELEEDDYVGKMIIEKQRHEERGLNITNIIARREDKIAIFTWETRR